MLHPWVSLSLLFGPWLLGSWVLTITYASINAKYQQRANVASEAEDEKYLRENVTILLSTKSENPARVGNVFILAQQIEDSLGWQLASSKRPSLPIPPPILIFKSSPNSVRIKETL